jgi:O-antigen/teichoic acid export membrane protein
MATAGGARRRSVRRILRRLVTAGASYQAADVVSRLLALVTLPLYTRFLSSGDYGTAETLVMLVVLGSIPLRLGLAEAVVRYGRSDRVASVALTTVALVTTVTCLVLGAFAAPLSQLVLGYRDPAILAWTIVGLWAFTNLEMAKALLRLADRRRLYMASTLANVGLTVALTATLVIGLDQGATGLVAGNFAISAVVLLALWGTRLRRDLRLPRPRDLRARLTPLLRFGLPLVPADAAVFALNVVDRAYLLRVDSASTAGLYALAIKLASVVVIVVRGFQMALPPLAYAIDDDDEAARLCARVTTLYVVATGWLVAAVTLLARQLVGVLAAPEFARAHEALPWLALGWALLGLFSVLTVIAGRAERTARTLPAAAAGLIVNVAALVTLTGPLGLAGAGIALCAAYAAMLVVAYALVAGVFPLPLAWGRLVHATAVMTATTLVAELLLPTTGATGLVSRLAAAVLIGPSLLATGWARPAERAWLRVRVVRLSGRARPLPAGR